MIDPPRVPSEEPTAVTPHGGICGAESQQWLSYPTQVGICGGGAGDRRLDPNSERWPASNRNPWPVGIRISLQNCAEVGR